MPFIFISTDVNRAGYWTISIFHLPLPRVTIAKLYASHSVRDNQPGIMIASSIWGINLENIKDPIIKEHVIFTTSLDNLSITKLMMPKTQALENIPKNHKPWWWLADKTIWKTCHRLRKWIIIIDKIIIKSYIAQKYMGHSINQ